MLNRWSLPASGTWVNVSKSALYDFVTLRLPIHRELSNYFPRAHSSADECKVACQLHGSGTESVRLGYEAIGGYRARCLDLDAWVVLKASRRLGHDTQEGFASSSAAALAWKICVPWNAYTRERRQSRRFLVCLSPDVSVSRLQSAAARLGRTSLSSRPVLHKNETAGSAPKCACRLREKFHRQPT